MKPKVLPLALGTALGLFALLPEAAVSQGARRGEGQVCVYEHAGYGGWEECYRTGESVRDLGRLRNQISSVRIQGRAEITLYQHPDFGGREVTVSNDVSDVRGWSKFWNDEVDSLRVSEAGFRGGRPDRHADRVCVYQHVGFKGKSQCFDAGEDLENLGSIGWNDGISSIRTFGRVRVALFEDSDYQGRRLVIDGDVADLTQQRSDGRDNWNDRISSLRVGGEGRGWTRDRRD